MVARTRYRLPLDESTRRKFDALGDRFDVRVLANGERGDETFRLVPPVRPRMLDGLAFYALLPLRVARELRAFRPDAVVVQGAHESWAALLGRRLAGSDARVVLDLHGDWRAAPRLYGSPLRRLLAPLGDRLARSAVRRADAVRTITGYTSGLVRAEGVEPAGTFPAFMDLEPFVDRPPEPLPGRPQALFVGVLERYKNVDGLAAAWRHAAPRVPDATLRIVGRGTLTGVVRDLVAELPAQTEWTESLTTPEIVRALDESTVLVLPSRSEGMGRVVVEAFCRGRAVIGARVGGIPDLVADGENGLLVEPEDTAALAEALVRALSDRDLAERLGRGGAASAGRWLAGPDEYAERLRDLVDRVTLQCSARSSS
jgi:glycosyltransferase involved in cell wall biosynthesis